jgi:hypothetical protein
MLSSISRSEIWLEGVSPVWKAYPESVNFGVSENRIKRPPHIAAELAGFGTEEYCHGFAF